LEWAPLAWVAFVPLLFVLDGKNYKSAFGWSYACGFLFFAGTMGWLVYVTWAGVILLAAYLAIYFGLFGLAWKAFKPLPLEGRLLVLPAAWAGLEFLRTYLFSGFGWVILGHSQYKNLLLIQIADIIGGYGVSFLIMLVNVMVFESMKSAGERIFRARVAVAAILVLVFAYGFWRMASAPQWPTVSVAVVQPNIPQGIKWQERQRPWIVRKTIDMSEPLQAFKPDMIVWPETSLPGIISDEPNLFNAITLAASRLRTPFLIGAITHTGETYYNSAYLISAQGKTVGHYHKIHLVPFGEYLPLRPVLGWINRFVPLEDFASGREYTILQAGPSKPFGVLICFEDTLDDVRRNLVNAGAGFLVNITNDAWFRDTKEPFLHLQGAVFGCVENKRSLVRAANTGVSGFVDPFGRILAYVQDNRHKKTFVEGTAFASIPVVQEKTFYTKYGDVFAWSCLLVILGGAGTLCRKRM